MRKFDIVLANPPYSIKTWDREAFINDKWGRNFLGTPPQSKADYAFIQHILSSMNDHGRCAILLPHGVLNRLIEKDIRQKLIQNDLIDAVISIGKKFIFLIHQWRPVFLFVDQINQLIGKIKFF